MLVSTISLIYEGISLSFWKSTTFIVKLSDLLLPSLVDAVIVAFPSDLAMILALFPITSISATFELLVDQFTSFTSASPLIDAVTVFSFSKYILENLLFIVMLSTKFSSPLTVTVIVFVVIASVLSSTLYVTLYWPSSFTLTVFSITSILFIVPSSLSDAVTPSNGLKAVPSFIVLSVAYISGGLFIPVSFEITTTLLCALDVLPLLSVAVYETLYSPGILTLTLLSTFNSIFSSSSITVTPSLGSKLSPTIKLWSLTPKITGALFAFTVRVIVFSALFSYLSIAVYVNLYSVVVSGSKSSSLSTERLTLSSFFLPSSALTSSIGLKISPAFKVISSNSLPPLVIIGSVVIFSSITPTCIINSSDISP